MVQRGRVLPALAERELQIDQCGTADLELDVVPGRSISVTLVELVRLDVTFVRGIVVATVT
jgi:hypothetical protein